MAEDKANILEQQINIMQLQIADLYDKIAKLEGTYDVGGVTIDGVPDYLEDYIKKHGGDK